MTTSIAVHEATITDQMLDIAGRRMPVKLVEPVTVFAVLVLEDGEPVHVFASYQTADEAIAHAKQIDAKAQRLPRLVVSNRPETLQ